MAQFFSKSANNIARISMLAAAVLGGLAFFVYTQVARSSYLTGRYLERQQPVQFSHKHHVGRRRHRLPLLPFDGRNDRFSRNAADPDLHELPQPDLGGQPVSGTRPGELSRQQTDRMGTRPRPSRIRLFQSQHPRRQRRRLFDVSRPDRQYAGGLSGKHAADGMVSRVPPRARKVYPAEIRDLQHAVAGRRSYCAKAARLKAEYKIRSKEMMTSCSTCHR